MHFTLGKGAGHGAFGDNGIDSLLVRFKKMNIQSYESIQKVYKDDLNDFIKSFGYYFDGTEFVPGWIYQIKSSVSGNFILEDHAYTKSEKDLEKIEIETLLADKEHHWKTPRGPLIGSTKNDDRWDWFTKLLSDQELSAKPEQYCSETHEMFKAHIYNGLTKMFNFS